jgi:glycosyltransferase involved in cell wall biosynthesis/O-antigen ligase
MKKYWDRLNNSTRGSYLKTGFLFLLTLSLAHFWSSGFRDAIIWGSFVLLVVLGAMKKYSLQFNAVIIASAIYLTWSLISSLYSVDTSLSLREWLKLAELIAATFVLGQILRTKKNIDRTLLFIVGALTIIYLYDIGVYLAKLGHQWQWGERWDQLSHYNAPNIYSALIIAVLPFAFYQISQQPKNIARTISLAIHVCAGLFLLYVLGSRTAQVALIVMIFFRVIFVKEWKKRIVGLTLFIICGALIFALNPRFRDPTAKNMFGRDENWRRTARLVKQEPILGHGYGNRIYQKVYHEVLKKKSRIPFEHAHNVFLEVAFESGAIGLAAYIPIWAVLFLGAWRISRSKDPCHRSLGISIFLAFSGLLVYFQASVPNGINRCLFWYLAGVTSAAMAVYLKRDVGKLSATKNMNKSVIIHTSAMRVWNGETNRVLNDLIAVRESGYRPMLLTPEESPLGQKAEQAGIDTHCFSFDNNPFIRLKEILKLDRLVKQQPLFAIHTHSSKDTWLVGHHKMLFGRRYKFIRTRHNINRVRDNYFNRKLYKKIDVIVALTESVRNCFDNLVELNVLSKNQFSIIPSAVDIQKFRPSVESMDRTRQELGVAPEDLLVGFIGRISYDKGTAGFIDAVKLMIARELKATFIVVGKCSEPRFQQALAELESDKVKVLGFKENVVDYYQAIDILVAPSLKEAQGTSIVEAMACGKPVIASSVGGIPEVIDDGVDGILIPPDDPEAIAEAVKRLARDNETRKNMGEAAEKSATAKYSFDLLKKRTQMLYRSLEEKNGT